MGELYPALQGAPWPAGRPAMADAWPHRPGALSSESARCGVPWVEVLQAQTRGYYGPSASDGSFPAEGSPSMPEQLWSCLSVVVGVPCAVLSLLQLYKFVAPRRRRSGLRLVQLRVGGIAWTRLDITDDRQL